MKRNVAAVCVALVAAGMLAGCGATTNLDATWLDPDVQRGAFKKALVIGLARDEGTRRAFESSMVEQFGKRHVEAVSSVDHMPLDVKLTKENFSTYFGDTGVDCVLLSRLAAPDKATIYTPGSSGSGPSPYDESFHTNYDTWWGVASSPDQMNTSGVVKIETHLYGVADKKLIWTGVSETFDYSDTLDGIKSFSSIVVPNLVDKGLFTESK